MLVIFWEMSEHARKAPDVQPLLVEHTVVSAATGINAPVIQCAAVGSEDTGGSLRPVVMLTLAACDPCKLPTSTCNARARIIALGFVPARRATDGSALWPAARDFGTDAFIATTEHSTKTL